MVDLLELVKKFYYNPSTNGSNSIKDILPAILKDSKFLIEKYSRPIYNGLNFSDFTWIQIGDNGKIINPYKLLPPIFKDIDVEMLDEMLADEEGEISDGGSAMIAYAQMQFSQMSEKENELICKSLLRYCELDTLAMVMIWEDWNNRINRKI